jgi:hypothetical protein
MLDETGAAEQLVPSQRNERSGNLAMTAITFDPRSAILHCLARPEVAPFGMKPASDYGYELTTISEVFDSYHGDCHLTRRRSGGKAIVARLRYRTRLAGSRLVHPRRISGMGRWLGIFASQSILRWPSNSIQLFRQLFRVGRI